MLPELVIEYFDDPESHIRIIIYNNDSRKIFKIYVQLNRPGEEPKP